MSNLAGVELGQWRDWTKKKNQGLALLSVLFVHHWTTKCRFKPPWPRSGLRRLFARCVEAGSSGCDAGEAHACVQVLSEEERNALFKVNLARPAGPESAGTEYPCTTRCNQERPDPDLLFSPAEWHLYYWPSLMGRGEFVRLLMVEAGLEYFDVALAKGPGRQ